MTNTLTIAVDAMGGDGAPKKIVECIIHHYKKNSNTFYRVFGDQEKISKFISNGLNKENFEIIHTKEIVQDTDTPLTAAKRGKNTSMWMAIDSVKNKKSDVIISAGNTEELKGNEIIKETYQKLNQIVNEDFEFKGFIEGNHLMDGNANVIVADGFTGNVALKTAEGTANFITSELKKAMTDSFLGKLGSLISMNSLKKFKKKLDPRLYNGAILLGLDSPVIKSHGGTDYIGFSNSLNVCSSVIKGNLIQKIKQKIN